jgi:hypothetical protein
MPCTNLRRNNSRHSDKGFFCEEHSKAYREILTGILNEAREHRNIKLTVLEGE